MKTRMILICALLAAVLLCACSQSAGQETPEDPVLHTEVTSEESTEEIQKETVPALCPPAPEVELIPFGHDPDRKETDVSTSEDFIERADGSTVRSYTEYAHDQDGNLMEVRNFVYEQNTLLGSTIQKYDTAGNVRDRENVWYQTDGSVLSYSHTIYDAQGRELLMREYATEEDGSIRYDNSYRYEYGADGSPVKTVSRHNPGGNAPSAREVYYGTAGAVIEESGWAFYETGSAKSWSYTRNTEDGVLLEDHRMQFFADGSLSMERLSRFAPSGAQLESKELSCHENGAVAHDFYEKYTEDGMLLEKSRLQYKEDGNVYFLHIEKYAETGEEIFYHHEQYFSDGSPEHKQLKEYHENGQLHFWEYQSYHSPGVPANISYTEYDAAGNLLKKEVTGYNEDGIITSQSKYPAEDGGDLMPVKKNTFYDNGNPEFIYDGLYNTKNTLMDGRAERYYENGQLWIQEIASYEEATRTRTSSETRYLEDGTVEYAWQRIEVFDDVWQVVSYDSTTLGSDLRAEYRQVSLYTYDASGNILTLHSTTYDGSGCVSYAGLTEYTYDGQGNVICENRIELDADGVQQNRYEFLYTYSAAGKQLQTERIQYNAAEEVTFRSVEEYDEAGLLLHRMMDAGKNIQTEEYTYHENGKMYTCLVTITPKDTTGDPVVQYRKTTWEYHENGEKKSETVQTWTSQDEKKAAPGTPQSELGKTYTANYDENGNRI